MNSTSGPDDYLPPADELDAELVSRVAEGDIKVFESWPSIDRFERLVIPHEFGLEWGLGVTHVIVTWIEQQGLRRRPVVAKAA